MLDRVASEAVMVGSVYEMSGACVYAVWRLHAREEFCILLRPLLHDDDRESSEDGKRPACCIGPATHYTSRRY